MGQWEGIQQQQTQQIFNMNMAYRSPSVEPQLALAQQPRLLQAGFAPVENDFMKSIPKGTLKAFGGILKMLTPEMSNKGAECPKEHLKRVITHLVNKYDKAVKIKNPDSFASKSGEVVGEIAAFGAVGKVIRVAEGVSLFATASEGGLYGAIIAEAHDTNKFAGVAFGFAGGGVGHCVGGVFSKIAKPTPLTDRALMPNAVYHSGFHPMGEMFVVDKSLPAKTLERLKNRSVGQIRNDWVFPKKGGATINGRWYTEHALERMAPRTPEVMAELEVRMLARAEKAGYKPQTEEFGEWLMKNAPNPRNIPPSVIEAEIAKPGSTNIRVELNQKGDVVTVIPRR
jgi:hypothetical protein